MSAAVNLPGSLPRLRRHESIRGGLRRVLLGCLERAGASMTKIGSAEVERVHAARVALKRARAVLRLADSCGLPWAQPARQQLVKLAGELGGVRDAAVLTGIARELGSLADFPGTAIRRSWPAWNRRLARERQRLEAWVWPRLTRDDCLAALADSMRLFRAREKRAKAGFSDRRLHDWRKSVIVVREQLNVLQAVLSARQQGHAACLHRVARALGSAQDLSLLLNVTKHWTPGSPLVAKARHKHAQAIKQARLLAKGLSTQLQRDFGVSEGGFLPRIDTN